MSTNKMRFLISVEATVTDPVAVLAAGVSSAVDTSGRPVDPYVPEGEFGLRAELGQTMMQAAMEALRDRDGVTPITASVAAAQTAEDGRYPAFTLPGGPASGA